VESQGGRKANFYQAKNREDAVKTLTEKLAIEDKAGRGKSYDVLFVGSGRNGLGAEKTKRIRSCEHRIFAIIYESCSPKSLRRDIDRLTGQDDDDGDDDEHEDEHEGCCGSSGYYVARMKCLDAFPNTEYALTLVMLLRKEKILMVPRGIPGSGKTNLGKLLSRTTAYMKNIQFVHIERDRVLNECRQGGLVGRNRARKEAAAYLRTRLSGEGRTKTAAAETPSSTSSSLMTSGKNLIYYLDTCNLKTGSIAAYVRIVKPDILIVLEFFDESRQAAIQTCCERVTRRLEHPVFPYKNDHARARRFLEACYSTLEAERIENLHPSIKASNHSKAGGINEICLENEGDYANAAATAGFVDHLQQKIKTSSGHPHIVHVHRCDMRLPSEELASNIVKCHALLFQHR